MPWSCSRTRHRQLLKAGRPRQVKPSSSRKASVTSKTHLPSLPPGGSEHVRITHITPVVTLFETERGYDKRYAWGARQNPAKLHALAG